MTVREQLFTTDPYLDFPVRNSQVAGWNSRHPKLGELIQEIQPMLILEIGSWLGASALFMAEHTDAEIVCCDTFTGAAEFWVDKEDPSRYLALKIEHGFPTVYRDFMSNVIWAGKQHQITPMPLPSAVGMEWLWLNKIRPDLIYVDGSHSYESTMSDIKWALRLSPKIICGDDNCSVWPGVQMAVEHHFGARAVVEPDSFWHYRSY